MPPSTLLYTPLGGVTPTGPTPTCLDNSLRLANQVTTVSSDGLVTFEGHVEICLSGTYYAICDEGWDDRDAQVACRTLANNTGSYSMSAALQYLV